MKALKEFKNTKPALQTMGRIYKNKEKDKHTQGATEGQLIKN